MNKKPDFYAIKTLALIFFGMIGVFALIYLIALAFTQKTLLNGILFGMLAILFAPLVNTVTGFFDDSFEHCRCYRRNADSCDFGRLYYLSFSTSFAN